MGRLVVRDGPMSLAGASFRTGRGGSFAPTLAISNLPKYLLHVSNAYHSLHKVDKRPEGDGIILHNRIYRREQI